MITGLESNEQSRTKRELFIIAVITAACLIPFINKAYHIDDTLFLWSAEQIQSDPIRAYDYSANWYGTPMPMSEIMQNPPLTSYFIAAVTGIFGWDEIPLHLAFFIPAVITIMGTYFIARSFCQQAVLAALIASFTPAFMISSTNVMSDVLMLSFYVSGIALWIHGLRRNKPWFLLSSALLIGLSALAKYYGATALLLVTVYTLFEKRKLHRSLFYLIIPIGLLIFYQYFTKSIYGHGLLSSAANYSIEVASKEWKHFFDKSFIGLAFTGGCMVSSVFMIPLLWPRKVWIPGFIGLSSLVLILLMTKGALLEFSLQNETGYKWPQIIQLTLFITITLHLLILVAYDVASGKDSVSILLGCWILGTLVFSTFFNWTTNGRTLLPMAPAIGILIARQYERRQQTRVQPLTTSSQFKTRICLSGALTLGALFALATTWADYAWANSHRKAAHLIMDELQPTQETIGFQGHWGFQYYMEKLGATAVDFKAPATTSQRYVIIPQNNTSKRHPPGNYRYLKTITLPACPSASTMGYPIGAGFYTSIWGPLPFYFGDTPEEKFFIYKRLF